MTKNQYPTPQWMQERKKLLAGICSKIETRKAAGVSVRQSVRYFSQRYHGKPFRSAPNRTISLAAPTLTQIYYLWLKQGDEALELHYQAPIEFKLTPEAKQAYFQALAKPGVRSRMEAIRQVQRSFPGFSPSTFFRHTPRAIRTKLTRLHRARCLAAKQEAELAKIVTKLVKGGN